VALQKKDFEVLAKAEAGMVWSPLSNLLLYGATADAARAREAGVLMALGPDWSPSGSKNLLGELKVARLVSGLGSDSLSDFELLSLATRNAAKILRWDKQLGTLERGKRADLLVVAGEGGDAHGHLFTRSEHDVELVVVNGVPRYGASQVVRRLLGEAAAKAETGTVGGRARLWYLGQPSADAVVGGLTLAEATDLLSDGMQHLPDLARDLFAAPSVDPDALVLVLDHDEPDGTAQRPHLPDRNGELTAMLNEPQTATPLSELLVPLTLDPLTVSDDSHFVDALAKQANLPKEVAAHVTDLF
jgi:5-methylthioadenosine/S-adenosylhomocysteine deaminase